MRRTRISGKLRRSGIRKKTFQAGTSNSAPEHLPRSLIERSSSIDIFSNRQSEAARTTVELSGDATRLLKVVAKDEAGAILNVRHFVGSRIQTGPEQFGGSSKRESARWQTALEELVREDLVIDCGYKGEVFKLTNLGWLVADEL